MYVRGTEIKCLLKPRIFVINSQRRIQWKPAKKSIAIGGQSVAENKCVNVVLKCMCA